MPTEPNLSTRKGLEILEENFYNPEGINLLFLKRPPQTLAP
jgi:hypothetical protein